MTDQQRNEKTEKEQRAKASTLLAIMLAANFAHWLLARLMGRYNTMLAGFAPTMAVMAIYYIIFPYEIVVQDIRKFSIRTWIVLVLAFLFGLANVYAFKHGLY